MRVLYVDDDRLNGLLFSEACVLAEGIDVEVETVVNASQALELVRDWQPDLLVLDLHLPDGRGTDLLPRLRTALGRPDLPAVLCTADETSVAARAAAAAGFDDCWSKPLDLKRVLAELQRIGHAIPPEAPR